MKIARSIGGDLTDSTALPPSKAATVLRAMAILTSQLTKNHHHDGGVIFSRFGKRGTERKQIRMKVGDLWECLLKPMRDIISKAWTGERLDLTSRPRASQEAKGLLVQTR